MDKPRVFKDQEGWKVKRPGYGFAKASTSKAYPTHVDALKSMDATLGSGSPLIVRTDTPEPYVHYHEVWQPVIR